MSGRKSLATLFLLGMGLGSTLIYANNSSSTYNNDLDLRLSVPALQSGFEISAAFLVLRPMANNLNYVIYNRAGLPIQSPSWDEQELDPRYTPAFSVGLGYMTASGRDVQLNWTHLNSDTSASIAAPDGYFVGPDYEIGPPAIPIRTASSTANFKDDVINLDFGQYLAFGCHVVMRFFGGLSTVFLREDVNTTYAGNVITGLYQGPFSTNQDVTSNFKGIGPRLGINGNYIIGHGFGILGEGAIAALIGSSHSNTSYISSSQQLIAEFGQSTNYQTIADENTTQVIPALDGKLGINYQHVFSNKNLLTVEAGYQAAIYINAINQYLPGSLVPGQSLDSGGIYVATMDHTQSNFSMQGPFLKLSLRFS